MAANKDVMLHSAVTIVKRKNGIEILGEKDIEVCQYAAEFLAKKWPVPEHHAKRAFDEMRDKCLEDMRAAGMLR